MRTAHIAVLCTGIDRNSDGILTIKGLYDGFVAPHESIRVPNVIFFLRILLDSNERLDLREKTGNLVLKQYHVSDSNVETLTDTIGPIPINLTPLPGRLGRDFVTQISEIRLPQYGTYRFDVIVDGLELSSIPLTLSHPSQHGSSGEEPADRLTMMVGPIPK